MTQPELPDDQHKTTRIMNFLATKEQLNPGYGAELATQLWSLSSLEERAGVMAVSATLLAGYHPVEREAFARMYLLTRFLESKAGQDLIDADAAELAQLETSFGLAVQDVPPGPALPNV